MEITNINQLDLTSSLYTYADYILWKFKQRVEILKGRIFKMSAPSIVHQDISRNPVSYTHLTLPTSDLV